MKNYLPFIIGLVILVMPFALMGCETATPAGTAPLVVSTETYNAGINALQAQINAKANQADLTTQTTRIDGLSSQGMGNTYTKGELYTRAEVDAAIAAAIAALKSNQAWITGSTHTTPAGTTEGEYGELMDTDGDLELWLEKVSGEASDVFTTRSITSTQGRFDLIVVNKDSSSSHDFVINLTLSPNADVTLGAVPSVDNKIEVSGSLLFSLTRTDTARNPLLAYQSNTGRITKGDIEDYAIWLTLKQTSVATPVEWDYDFNIKDKD